MHEKNKQFMVAISMKKDEKWHVIQQTDCLEGGILVVESILSFMRLSQMRFEIRLDVS